MIQEHSTISGPVSNRHGEEDPLGELLGELLHDAAGASRELKGLIAEVHGLARVVKAGKVPRPKQIKRIGKDLARWDSQFNTLMLDLAVLVGKAEREGLKKGLFSIPINDEPFNSIFSAAMKWQRRDLEDVEREHPKEAPELQ